MRCSKVQGFRVEDSGGEGLRSNGCRVRGSGALLAFSGLTLNPSP